MQRSCVHVNSIIHSCSSSHMPPTCHTTENGQCHPTHSKPQARVKCIVCITAQRIVLHSSTTHAARSCCLISYEQQTVQPHSRINESSKKAHRGRCKHTHPITPSQPESARQPTEKGHPQRTDDTCNASDLHKHRQQEGSRKAHASAQAPHNRPHSREPTSTKAKQESV